METSTERRPRKRRRKLRIAMIGPRGGGGIATHLTELAKRIEMRGNQVSFISPIRSISPVGGARFARELLAGYDIVHVHGSYETPALVTGLMITRAAGGATVYTTHGTGSRYWRKGNRWGGLWREAAKRVDAIISVSDYVRRRMVQVLGEDPPKQVTIHNGVDAHHFYPVKDSSQSKQTIGVAGRYVILYVGRLSSNKGIGHLLNAMPKLKKVIPEATLLIGGRGELEGALKRKALELGVTDVVDFRGHVPQELLREYYGASDVVVVPSTYEPGGITPLEAMSMRKPVVGAETGGIAETLLDGIDGLMVPPGDPEAIFQAVKRLYDDPDLASALSERARSKVIEQYSWDDVARDTLQVYSEVLAGKRRPRLSGGARQGG